MKILFDQGTPAPLRNFLQPHVVETAFERRWNTKKNGELIAAAEAAGHDCLVTTDQNLGYQQNLKERKLAIVVLSTTSWPRIRRHVELVQAAVGRATVNSFEEVTIPAI